MTIYILCDIYRDLDKEAKSGKLNGTIQRFVGVRGPELGFYNA
jgi:pyruvate ferredoxin oxidoreductase alpha subunit